MSHASSDRRSLKRLWYRLPAERRREIRDGPERWFWDLRHSRPEVIGFDELQPVEWVECMGRWMVGYPSPDGHSIRLEDGGAQMVASTKPGRGEPWWSMDIFDKHGWIYDASDDD